MARIGVLHITDTLEVGGYEKVAVNLVNLLPANRYRPYLCTTRREGPLAESVKKEVGRLQLSRRQRFDIDAVRRLVKFIRVHDIKILHAHGQSLFISALASLSSPYPVLVWHDHYGNHEMRERPVWLYRLVAGRIGGVIAVNQPLADWSRQKLGISADKIWYIPNFVCDEQSANESPTLPGTKGARIICVANFRAQKDHPTLLRALALVIRQVPGAHLFLVGRSIEHEYASLVRKEITTLGLDQNVSLLGEQKEVSGVLRACDIGVLSSASEGLPLALLEYGMAGLPAVATDVGQCSEVLDNGRAGILVPVAAPDKLASAMLSLLQSSEWRSNFAKQLQCRVRELYSPSSVTERIYGVYESVLNGPTRRCS